MGIEPIGIYRRISAVGPPGVDAAAANELEQDEALRFATQSLQTGLALVRLEPQNTSYLNELGIAYGLLAIRTWGAGRLRAAIASLQKSLETFSTATSGGVIEVGNFASTAEYMASLQAQSGDLAGASATLAAAASVTSRLHLAGGNTELLAETEEAAGATRVAYERGDFTAARHIVRDARKRWQTRPTGAFQMTVRNLSLCDLDPTAGQAEYATRRFLAAEQSERTALEACTAAVGFGTAGELDGRRTVAKVTIWLSMALAKRNHGDQWLPLEFAEALYAQTLTDSAHRAALLRQASQLVDHLTPSIARLHDTREWRARIQKAQRGSDGQAAAR